MAELNLKQIVDKLNTEFSGDTRKLVFWYDEKGEFAEDIDRIELTNAKVYKLEQGSGVKYFRRNDFAQFENAGKGRNLRVFGWGKEVQYPCFPAGAVPPVSTGQTVCR